MTKKIHVIGGPTASGKSAFALEIAERENGVIINADSMQIYDGLHMLTAQPPASDLALFPHKLYSALHPNEDCSAGNWREMVEPLIGQVLEEGKTPIIVGGSGLYINSLLYGLSPIPDIADEVRARVNATYAEMGAEEFYAELQARDPIMAARFHANHKARIIRAWEVLEATGKSLAEWQDEPLSGPPDDWEFDVKLIIPERETLYERCNSRFVYMMEHGAVEEVGAFEEAIRAGEIKDNCLLTKALGVPALRGYLKGDVTKEDAIRMAQGQTRKYAKRQVTWFRNQVVENKNIAQIGVIV